jgi:hypothetical protein
MEITAVGRCLLFQIPPAAGTPDNRRYFGHRREDSFDGIQFRALPLS